MSQDTPRMTPVEVAERFIRKRGDDLLAPDSDAVDDLVELILASAQGDSSTRDRMAEVLAGHHPTRSVGWITFGVTCACGHWTLALNRAAGGDGLDVHRANVLLAAGFR